MFSSAELSQLVPAVVSLRVRDLQNGGRVMFASALETQFARDVRAGLTQPEQKTLPCQYLYDNIGSALFEAITFLPEYGLTRADARVIEAHADDLLDSLASDLMIAELGSGSGAKTRTILERVQRRQDA